MENWRSRINRESAKEKAIWETAERASQERERARKRLIWIEIRLNLLLISLAVVLIHLANS